MTELFADTSFFVSFLNPADTHHDSAAYYMNEFAERIICTEFILAELGNYLSATNARQLFVPFVREIRSDTRFEILPADERMIDSGLVEYERVRDKKWSFTDCTSFVVMRRRKITESLTADRHFQQAGFVALFK
ncbi:MAG TPA: PIN domain-containing protein [Tepidisphaeraceae bacterium]|jgi:predicted nucleic acid-binding protein